ncbi:MAG: DEAD/DEAH box helicase [Actinomycetota bacterium]|nr:DEAD/DEAH box helicase [Actinomycetota bacterium]
MDVFGVHERLIEDYAAFTSGFTEIHDRRMHRRTGENYLPGVKAIIVYPMNALANSQLLELEKFLCRGYAAEAEPVTFRRYTGQDRESERVEILRNPPDILLTNYVMLELLLTRPEERERLITAAQGLRFLVLDELHTYRGRQGADVALLARRLRDACAADALQCVGTSATMTTEGSEAQRRDAVAEVASRLFGVPVSAANVIGETLARTTSADPIDDRALADAVDTHRHRKEMDFDGFVADPLARWTEERFGVALDPVTGRLRRPTRPSTLPEAARRLSEATGRDAAACEFAIQAVFRLGSRLLDPRTGRPVFAFRLHQFLSKGDSVYLSIEPPERRYITSRYQTVVPDGTNHRVLLPAVFCQQCGQEYLAVQQAEQDGVRRYLSRRDSDASGGDASNGYLFISSEVPWPESVDIALGEQRLPESWLVTEPDGRVTVATRRRKHLPELVHVDVGGREVQPGEGTAAVYVGSPFAFCLRCRTSYEQLRSSDFAKLSSLSVEGRSSATSVISASVVRSLGEQPEISREGRKLLAFADNRQDASLQAGHFNDFVQVTQLRGALYRALRKTPGGSRTR